MKRLYNICISLNLESKFSNRTIVADMLLQASSPDEAMERARGMIEMVAWEQGTPEPAQVTGLKAGAGVGPVVGYGQQQRIK